MSEQIELDYGDTVSAEVKSSATASGPSRKEPSGSICGSQCSSKRGRTAQAAKVHRRRTADTASTGSTALNI